MKATKTQEIIFESKQCRKRNDSSKLAVRGARMQRKGTMLGK